MDAADRAQEQIERDDEARLRYAHLAPLDALATGRCLNCDAELGASLRFCGPECRDDWARLVAAMARRGRVDLDE